MAQIHGLRIGKQEATALKYWLWTVGGSNIKILATGQDEPRKFSSGPEMTAEQMVAGVKELAEGWEYDVVSVGYPGTALRDRVVSEPHNLSKGWVGVGFDFASAFDCPVKLINDAAMQALGSYQDEKLLFLGLGTTAWSGVGKRNGGSTWRRWSPV